MPMKIRLTIDDSLKVGYHLRHDVDDAGDDRVDRDRHVGEQNVRDRGLGQRLLPCSASTRTR